MKTSEKFNPLDMAASLAYAAFPHFVEMNAQPKFYSADLGAPV
jgi:hypothetical protein